MVTLTQTERISVIITTHYIEEARQANVVGLMRHGKILAENSPDELMRIHQLTNLEDVFLKLCMTDSSRRAASLAGANGMPQNEPTTNRADMFFIKYERELSKQANNRASSRFRNASSPTDGSYSHRWVPIPSKDKSRDKQTEHKTVSIIRTGEPSTSSPLPIEINHQSSSRVNFKQHHEGYTNEIVEDFSSEEEPTDSSDQVTSVQSQSIGKKAPANYRHLIEHASHNHQKIHNLDTSEDSMSDLYSDDYLAVQAVKWSARRSNALSLMKLSLDQNFIRNSSSKPLAKAIGPDYNRPKRNSESGFYQWCRTLMAVTWKNYIRLRRNPPVLVFQFMLPAIQVILFCLCIGGEPFDVPVAIVNDETVPRSSLQFLNGLSKKIIRQVKYDNLTSAIEAVRRGHVWGAIHIPDKYSQNLQSRLIMGEEVSNETISNGTIRVYPDLTSK